MAYAGMCVEVSVASGLERRVDAERLRQGYGVGVEVGRDGDGGGLVVAAI